jgi:muramoyltetrapeptide carboxypeptidase
MEIIIPKKLQKGDVVGIIAPSKALRDNEYTKYKTKQGIKFLESFGLKVKFSEHCYDCDFMNGSSIENRVKDIHEMFLDPEIKMIMMICGGNGVNLVIDKLDYNLIKNNPKIFCGMSDGTLLTNAIYLKSNLQTYYGINLNDSIGQNKKSNKIRDNFYNTFFKNENIIISENLDLNFTHWSNGETFDIGYKGWNILKHGKSQGLLTGGYLNRLITTDYAGFNIDYNNRILFFETGDNLKDLMTDVTSMKEKGVFKKLKGLILGYCYNEQQKDVADLICVLLEEYDFPILQIGELGHNVENYLFPIGAKCSIDTSKKEIIINK